MKFFAYNKGVVLLFVCHIAAVVGLSSSTTTSTTSVGHNNDNNKLMFTNLDESKFRHPLDRDLTKLIQNVLPFSDIASKAVRQGLSVIQQGVRLDLLSSSVKVSEKQLPELYNSLTEACQILDLSSDDNTNNIPELYVQSNSQANAYTLAFQTQQQELDKNDDDDDVVVSSRPIVVVTSGLLEKCTPQEIQAIIGHELGHLKCEHSVYFTLGGLATIPIQNLPFGIGQQTQSLLEDWRLAAEYTCDRAALLVAQELEVVQSAMLVLVSGGLPSSMGSTSTQAFVDQCKEYDRLLKSANPFVRASIQMQQRTHPLPVKRVVALEKFAQSKEYQSIMDSGRKTTKQFNEEE